MGRHSGEYVCVGMLNNHEHDKHRYPSPMISTHFNNHCCDQMSNHCSIALHEIQCSTNAQCVFMGDMDESGAEVVTKKRPSH